MEIRGWMGRRSVSQTELARALGMSQPAHDALRARIERDPTADVAALARQVKAEFPRNRHNPRFDPWGDAVRARLQAGYAEDVARLAAMPGVRLLRPR